MLLNRLIGFLLISTLILFLFFFFGPNSIQLTSKIVDQKDAPLEPLRNYVYRVGIFEDPSKAENLIAKFRSKDVLAYSSENDDLIFVYIGPFIGKEKIIQSKTLYNEIAGVENGVIEEWK